MRIKLAAAVLLTGLTLAACTDSSDSSETSESSTPTTVATKTVPAGAPDQNAEPETAALPDMTGKSLQDAQDTAQAAGFWTLTSSDATGMKRMQVLDSNWKVCSQTPAAGEHPTTVTVNFDAVKLDESC